MTGMIEREAKRPGLHASTFLTGIAQSLAVVILRASSGSIISAMRSNVAQYWVGRACDAIAAQVYSGKSARECVAELGLSYRHLSRYFEAERGQTPKAYQVQMKIREAEKLLASTCLPVTAIAFELGYQTSQHFATQFRSVLHISPREYRASLQNKTLQDK